jgi:hypothetical protein
MRLPKWPLWVVVTLLFVVEILFLVMFIGEGDPENLPTILNSVGLLVSCALIWRGIPWGRWLLIALLVWRVTGIGISLASHFGDHRTSGSLTLIGFYVVIALLVASSLGRVRLRAST